MKLEIKKYNKVIFINKEIIYKSDYQESKNKIIKYIKTDSKFIIDKEYYVDFEINEDNLLIFALSNEYPCQNQECVYNNNHCYIEGCGGYFFR